MARARAHIGFHSAYNMDTGQASGMMNAIVGAYLSIIGLDYEAIIYITKSDPDSSTWLTFEDAKKIGIDAARLRASGGARLRRRRPAFRARVPHA